MKTIRIYFPLIALLLSSAVLYGQKNIFKGDVQKFIDLSNESKWEEVIDMMHPKMFGTFSKDQMIKMMNQMNAMGLKTNTKLKQISKIHPAIDHESSSYQKIDYDVEIMVTLTEQMWPQKDFILQGVKRNFGGDDIKVDEANKTLTMNGVQSMIAIKANSANEWKYLTYQGPEDSMAKSALPTVVYDEIVK